MFSRFFPFLRHKPQIFLRTSSWVNATVGILGVGWWNISDDRRCWPVDNNLAQIVENFAGLVLTGLELKQLRILVNEPRAHMVQHIEDEWNVSLDATNPDRLPRLVLILV